MSFTGSPWRSLAAAAALIAGIATTPIASAADLPLKAPVPVATPWVLDVHGYFDLNFQSSRVTGSGLLLYRTDVALVQPSAGLRLDIYKDPNGFINSFSVYGGIWNENWVDSTAPTRHWQEMDWWGGFTVGFAKYWTFTGEHVEFVFPGGGSVYNYDFTLAFNDASFWPWQFAFNPYVTFWYVADGGAVPLGTSTGYRVTVGVNPSVTPWKQIPLTFNFPTSVTFAPETFWNRNNGTTNFCGPFNAAPCALSNLGFVTTGIDAKLGLESIIPKRLGSWYVKAGVHYFGILNDALLASQTPVGTGVVATFNDAKRDIFIFNGGVGFSF
jgi:hypothetical protein